MEGKSGTGLIVELPDQWVFPGREQTFGDREGGGCSGNGHPVFDGDTPQTGQVRNKDFRNFNKFREALWKAVANDAELAKQFEPSILATMKKGRAPLAKRSERRGLRIKLELHHKVYIAAGGGVYDIDNIVILTPNRHINTHNGSGE
ncbi:HNH endonuclease signature motif containing protein [Pseudomonas baltica]|uniref:HNH endonuclease signature motif containing protein n=1 Tax=Pseudomonas baltica TaxID=2762576 RepID=UPI00289D647D|nr:HNH endonuclease signature motif containing protein [Pseudomonas baltica]